MPHIQFPCQYLYWSQIEDHLNIKERYKSDFIELKKKYKENKPFKRANFITNFSKDPNGFYDFLKEEDIKKIVWKPINEMLMKINNINKPTKLTLQSYWVNFYDKGQFQEMHDHLGDSSIINGKLFYPMFSIIYIVNDETNNSITFDLNERNIPFARPIERFVLQTSDISEIKEGTVLIFSSTLKHGVDMVKSDNRITIAFNVLGCFD
jgi:hypothetical protein